MFPFEKIAIVGCGNVACNYIKTLISNGIHPEYIFVRDESKFSEVRMSFGVEPTNDYNNLLNCNLVIIAVKDDAIADVAANFNNFKGLLVHTSGTQPSSLLNNVDNYGILYPLQTLTKNYDINFRSVPILINASSQKNKESLMSFAKIITDIVIECSDDDRRYIHMSAVYVSNFVNIMLQIGGKLLESKNLDVSILEPLVRETINKAFAMNPENSLTGPARRNDKETISKHLMMLENKPEEKKIYELLTNYIINKYEKL